MTLWRHSTTTLGLFIAIFANIAYGADAACGKTIVANAGDSCATVAAAQGITVNDFLTDNPDLTNCRLTVGKTYCVASAAGGPSIPDTPASSPAQPQPTSTPPPSGLTPSPDGSEGICGDGTGYTCIGSPYGNCCSESGYCGDTAEYCGEGCKAQYGNCGGGTTTGIPAGCPLCGPGGEVTVTKTVTSVTTKQVTSVVTSVQTTTKTITPSTSTTRTTASAAPSPTLAGTNKKCNRWYQYQGSYTCQQIARGYSITINNLYSWNPNFDCDDLEDMVGYYICVGLAS